MDTKIVILVIALIALCAFLGGLLLGGGGPETDSDGEGQLPSETSGDDSGDNTSISSLFSDPGDIEPPALPF